MKPVHFSPETSEQIQQLTGIIVQLAHPDKIWLLGHTLRHEQYEGIFHEVEVGQERLAHCTLLVLLPDLANKEPHQWQDQLEQHCGALLPVTTLVLCTAGFTAWLRSGHPFALHVWRQAPVLYDADNMQIEIVPELVAPVNSKEIIKEGLSKAREFLAGAELYRLRQQYKMAAFMLHQCVEQALQALLKAGTGYHTHTHNIERLLQLCCLVVAPIGWLISASYRSGQMLVAPVAESLYQRALYSRL
ncbi:HEPN domain-containing protein [Niabella defluvii]|nr:HEPN domain-containing protein [Niabella sp. I65]